MFEIKIFQDTSKVNTKGLAPLTLICRTGGRTVKIPTGISVVPAHFSFDHQSLSKKTPDYRLLTDRLSEIAAQFKAALIHFQHQNNPAPSDAEVRRYVSGLQAGSIAGEAMPASDSRIGPFFARFYAVSARRRKQSYLKTFSQVEGHLTSFNPILTWEALTEPVLDSYVDYLIDLELANATIHNHIKNLKVVASEARKAGYTVCPAIDDYKYAGERTRPIALTREELSRFVALAPAVGTAGWKAWTRWLFRCYTSLRISECEGLTRKNFYHESGELVVRYTSHKTKKENILPVAAGALAVLEQCGFRIPRQSRQGEAVYVKELCQLAGINDEIIRVSHSGTVRREETLPKWQLISSHTARRTFGKRFIEEGGSLFDLQIIYQHDSLKTTAEYIDIQITDLLRTSKSIMNRI